MGSSQAKPLPTTSTTSPPQSYPYNTPFTMIPDPASKSFLSREQLVARQKTQPNQGGTAAAVVRIADGGQIPVPLPKAAGADKKEIATTSHLKIRLIPVDAAHNFPQKK